MQCKKSLLVLIMYFIFLGSPLAESCDYKERAKLNNEVGNIKAGYEIKKRVLDRSEYDLPDYVLGTEEEATYEETAEYIEVNILNLTENTYLVVRNDHNDEEVTYTFEQSQDGKISFNYESLDTPATYTFEVLASNNTSCENTSLRSITLKLPRFNQLSEYALCDQIPDYYLCQRFVSFDYVGTNDFLEKAEAEIARRNKESVAKKEAKWYQKAWNFVVEHKVYFISGTIILVIASISGITIYIIRRRRNII